VISIIVNAEALFAGGLVAAIIIQALSSWIMPGGMGRFSLLLHDLTDPILTPIRRTVPPFGMLDLSPMIACVLIWIMGQFLIRITLALA
jgi:YggT family protein